MSDLLVVTDATGRSLVVREHTGGRFVVCDFDGRELADLGDLTPFLVGDRIVFGGAAPGPDADRVEITTPGFDGIHQSCRVKNSLWMSFPEPFVDGMVVTARWWRGSRVLAEVVSEPLRPDALRPLRRPGWTEYSPL
jgi:hypothetical protein